MGDNDRLLRPSGQRFFKTSNRLSPDDRFYQTAVHPGSFTGGSSAGRSLGLGSVSGMISGMSGILGFTGTSGINSGLSGTAGISGGGNVNVCIVLILVQRIFSLAIALFYFLPIFADFIF